jgi:TRAP-type transport system small permease protein
MGCQLVAAVEWLERGIAGLERILLCSLVVLTFCLTLAQVLFRYVLNNPLVWSEELVRYLLVWTAMVGAAGALRVKSHFSLTTFVANLRPRTGAAVSLLVDVAMGTFAAVLLVKGLDMTIAGFAESAVSFPISMGWFYLAVPVGGGLMLWHIVARTVATCHTRAVPQV